MIINVKYVLFLLDLNETWILSTNFLKIFKYQSSQKIHPTGAELFMRKEGQTDGHDEVNSSF